MTTCRISGPRGGTVGHHLNELVVAPFRCRNGDCSELRNGMMAKRDPEARVTEMYALSRRCSARLSIVGGSGKSTRITFRAEHYRILKNERELEAVAGGVPQSAGSTRTAVP